MKRAVILLFLIMVSFSVCAQNRRLIVRGFEPADIGDMRARTSPVMDNNKKLAALVDVSFAASDAVVHFEGSVGEPVHYPGEWLIHVPEGTTRIKVSMEECKPLEFIVPTKYAIESGMVYLMDLDIEEAVKLRSLILPSVSTSFSSPVHFSYGAMVGVCKHNGVYLHVKTDFSFGLKTTMECDAEGLIDNVKGWYSGESKQSRLAITGGYMRHLFDFGDIGSMYVHIGAGYGSRTVAWQMLGSDGNYQYVKVSPSSFSGLEADTGLILRFGGYVLSAGVQTNSFKFYEANIGIGIMI